MGRIERFPVGAMVALTGLITGGIAYGQIGPVMPAPRMVVPQYPEVGIGIYVSPSASSGGGGVSGQASGSTGTSSPTGPAVTGGSALAELESTSYGQQAVAAAEAAGIDPNELAAFALVESNFQNVGDASGTTSATGPWQVTQGTFNSINQKYGLGFSPSDITNPADEAVVAAYTIQDYAQSVSNITGSPATGVQTYGAYVFGPLYGGSMAAAPPSTPLSQIVPASELANNNMQGWTVGQFYSTEGRKLGSPANSPALMG